MSAPGPRPPPLCPYRGLAPFREEHAPFFYGRKTDIELILANLRASRLTVLYGASGTGKTSILQAGVVQRLRRLARENLAQRGRPELAVVVLREWHDEPLAALLEAVREAVGSALGGRDIEPPAAGLGWVESLEHWTRCLDGSLLLILDQFEDFLLYQPEEDREGTLGAELPRALAQPDLRVNFLISLRDDSLAQLDRFKGRIRALLDNRLRLDHLDREAASAAIEGPLAELSRGLPAGEPPFSAEPELVEAVLDQVVKREAERATAEARIETPYLQLVLTKLWNEEMAAGSRVLRRQTLERLGKVDSIVDEHVREVFAGLSRGERRVARRTIRHLVTASGGRTVQGAADLAEVSRLPAERIEPVLHRLSGQESRLLRPLAPSRGQPGEVRFEVLHDVLARPVLEWWREEQVRTRQRLWAGWAGGIAALAIAGLLARDRWEGRVVRLARLDALPALAAAVDDPLLGALLLAESDPRREPPGGVQAANRLASEWLPEVVLRGHTERVTDLEFSPDGERLVSGAGDGTVRVWELTSRPMMRVLASYNAPLLSVALSPDGQRVAAAAGAGSVRLLWLDGSKAAEEIGDAWAVTEVAWSPDGRRIATAGFGALQVRDAGSLSLVKQLSTEDGFVAGVAFSPDGRTLAVIPAASENSAAGRMSILSSESGRELQSVEIGGYPSSLAFSPDGRYLATTSARAGLMVWSAGKPLKNVLRIPGVADVAFLPDGGILAGSMRGDLQVWKPPGLHQPEAEAHGLGTGRIRLAASRDGRRIATGLADGSIRIYRAQGSSYPVHISGVTAPVVAAGFTADGKGVLASLYDGSLKRFGDPDPQRQSWVRGPQARRAAAAAISQDGGSMASLGFDGSVELWDARQGVRSLVEAEAGDPATSIAIDSEGRRVVVGFQGGALRLFHEDGSLPPTELGKDESEVVAMAVSPRDGRLATGSASGVVKLWPTGSRAPPSALASGEGSVVSLAFDAAGRRLAAIWERGNVSVLSVDGSEPRADLPGLGARLRSVALSPDGQRVAVGDAEGRVSLWSPEENRSPATLGQLRGEILTLAFSPDGSRLVAGSSAGEAKIWTVSWPMLLDLLRASTTACLTPEQRVTYLAESPSAASAGAERCEGRQGRRPLFGS